MMVLRGITWRIVKGVRVLHTKPTCLFEVPSFTSNAAVKTMNKFILAYKERLLTSQTFFKGRRTSFTPSPSNQ